MGYRMPEYLEGAGKVRELSAFYAGRAFTRGCVGYVHAIGHTLGSLYGVVHGLAMAVLLPHVMKEYGCCVHKCLAELADVCGIRGTNESEKANAFLRWIEETNAKMGLPDRFDVIQEEDIEQMISWAKKEADPLYPVPVEIAHDLRYTVLRRYRNEHMDMILTCLCFDDLHALVLT